MHVILDSTALISDFYLTTLASRGLLEGSKAGVIRLGVPELVLLEVIHKWGQRVEQEIVNARSVAKAAKRLGLEGLEVTIPELDDEVRRFGISLRQKLQDASVTIYPIPGVSHEFLVNKAVQRQSPFADNGSGYRDALIWETIKGILRTGDDAVTFVTNNTSDFGSSSGTIRKSLLEELTHSGIEHERLMILTSAADAAAATLEHARSVLDLFEQKLDLDKAFTDRFFQELVESADQDLRYVERLGYSSDGRARFVSAESLYDIGYFKTTKSWLLSKGKIGIEFEAEADIDVEVEFDAENVLPHHFDPQRDHWYDMTLERFGSVTVTASLSGQFEFDEASGEASSVSMSIWALSDPPSSR